MPCPRRRHKTVGRRRRAPGGGSNNRQALAGPPAAECQAASGGHAWLRMGLAGESVRCTRSRVASAKPASRRQRRVRIFALSEAGQREPLFCLLEEFLYRIRRGEEVISRRTRESCTVR